MKTLRYRLSLCLFFLISFSFVIAQKPNKQAAKKVAIQQAIDSQSYIFHAQQALPLGGGTRQLTTDYYLQVTPDSVITYLPYFGRAYYVPYNDTEGGININTNKFSYQKTAREKGGWNIVIKPTERMDVQELVLFISDEGYGTLQIVSNNRQAISFNGYTSKK
jgi:hypothetical protein